MLVGKINHFFLQTLLLRFLVSKSTKLFISDLGLGKVGV